MLRLQTTVAALKAHPEHPRAAATEGLSQLADLRLEFEALKLERTNWHAARVHAPELHCAESRSCAQEEVDQLNALLREQLADALARHDTVPAAF